MNRFIQQNENDDRLAASASDNQRPRVLILTSDELFPHFFSAPTLAKLDAIADWSRCAERADSPALRALIGDADALLTTWHSPFLRPEMLADARRLQLIAHCGGEVKARMQPEIIERLIVTNAPDAMAAPVAEMALALALALARRLPEYSSEMRAGGNVDNTRVAVGETLLGQNIGIVGFGRIGQAFARFAALFGGELLVADPHCAPETAAQFQIKIVDLNELLARCRFVVLAAGLTDATRGMLDAQRLALLQDGACLVNVARGGLIVMDALLAELRSGRIKAALDVTDPFEPLPLDHELRRLPNVILTPHVAAGGIEVRQATGAEAVEEVRRFFAGETVRHRVTSEMLAKMT